MDKQEIIDYLYSFNTHADITIEEMADDLAISSAEPKVGRCEDCKHFRKLPLRTDTIGKCDQHWGVCPNGDWYCADFEPRESEG